MENSIEGKFRLADYVELVVNVGAFVKGSIGIIMDMPDNISIGVQFIEEHNFNRGHELRGLLKQNSGWYVLEDQIKFHRQNIKTMSLKTDKQYR